MGRVFCACKNMRGLRWAGLFKRIKLAFCLIMTDELLATDAFLVNRRRCKIDGELEVLHGRPSIPEDDNYLSITNGRIAL